MSAIKIVNNPGADQLAQLGVKSWSIWEKEPSTFPWTYDATEICYLLQGDVTVTPHGGTPVHFKAGDLVTFPAGMSCSWEIRVAVRKHYKFES